MDYSRRPHQQLLCFTLVLGVATLTSAQTWTGLSNSDWNTTSNWSTGTLPNSSSTAQINLSSGTMPVISSANAIAYIVGVGDAASSDASLFIQNGRTLSGTLVGRIASDASSTGHVTVTGSGSAWNFSGASPLLDVGRYGAGTVNILSGAMIAAKTVSVGVMSGSSGGIVVDGTGSTFSATRVTVGTGSTGSLMVSAGGAASFTELTVGYRHAAVFEPYGTGTTTVTGAGSSLSMTGALYVGQGSAGTLTISNGASVSNASAYIGWDIGDTSRSAAVNVSGTGTSWTTNGVLWVSSDVNGGGITYSSTATITLSGGSISSNGAIIGYGNNTSGTITQTGGTLAIGSSGLQFNNGTAVYHLQGGTLQVGGTAGIISTANTHIFDLAGGTIQVMTTALTTSVKATLAAGTDTTLDTNGLGATWSGLLSGSGALTKTGAGTLTLSGANTYSGGTTVEAGQLFLAASTGNSAVGTGALTINTAASLAGTGDIAASFGTIHGTLLPGADAVGQLDFTNSLTLTSTSILQFDLASGASYDQLRIGGTLTTGGTLAVNLLGGFAPTAGHTFNLFDTTNLIAGTFSTLDLATLSSGLTWDTSSLYTTGSLSVVASAVPEPSTYALLAGAVSLVLAFVRRSRLSARCP